MNDQEMPWTEAVTVKEFCDHIGVSDNVFETLRAIERHNIEAVTLVLFDDTKLACDYPRAVMPDEPIKSLDVHGIAWDGTDWEWCESIDGESDKPLEKLDAARAAFHDALLEHDAEMAALASTQQEEPKDV